MPRIHLGQRTIKLCLFYVYVSNNKMGGECKASGRPLVTQKISSTFWTKNTQLFTRKDNIHFIYAWYLKVMSTNIKVL